MASDKKLWSFSASEVKDMKVVDFIQLLNIQEIEEAINLGQESVAVRLGRTLDNKEDIRANYCDLNRIRDNLQYLQLIQTQLQLNAEDAKQQTPEDSISPLVNKLDEQLRAQTKGAIRKNTTVDFEIHPDGRVTVVMTAETYDGRSFWLSETK